MTSSLNGPRQPGRSDLSARAGESFGAWTERVRRAAVIDPELADAERCRMEATDQQRREAASRSSRQVGPHQAVLLTELDEPRRELLERKQRAIAEVLSSGIYRYPPAGPA